MIRVRLCSAVTTGEDVQGGPSSGVAASSELGALVGVGSCTAVQLEAGGHENAGHGKSERHLQSSRVVGAVEDVGDMKVEGMVVSAEGGNCSGAAAAAAAAEVEDKIDAPGDVAGNTGGDAGSGVEGDRPAAAAAAGGHPSIQAVVHKEVPEFEEVLVAHHRTPEGRIDGHGEGRYEAARLLSGDAASTTAGGQGSVPTPHNAHKARGAGVDKQDLDVCIPRREKDREEGDLHARPLVLGQVASTCLRSAPCVSLARASHRHDASHPSVAVPGVPCQTVRLLCAA